MTRARSVKWLTCMSHSIVRARKPWTKTIVLPASAGPVTSAYSLVPSSATTVALPRGGAGSGSGRV
jgi:hypothetical protein